jgi:hypothetical protein
VEEVLTLPDIILPGGRSVYTSGYHITWWRMYLPFRILYYLVEEVLTLPDILLPGGGSAYLSGFLFTWLRKLPPGNIISGSVSTSSTR